MREVESLDTLRVHTSFMKQKTSSYLALSKLWFYCRPCLTLRSIAKEIHDNCAFRDCLVYLEKIGSWYPSILLGFFPGRAILPNANDDIQAIVPKVEALTMPLRAVADQC